jgi:hypothetical protein
MPIVYNIFLKNQDDGTVRRPFFFDMTIKIVFPGRSTPVVCLKIDREHRSPSRKKVMDPKKSIFWEFFHKEKFIQK